MISAAVLLIAHAARGGGTLLSEDLCKMQQIPQHPPPSLFTIPFLLPPPHFRKVTGYSATCTQAGLSEIQLLTNLRVWRSRNITIYTPFSYGITLCHMKMMSRRDMQSPVCCFD